MTLTRIGMGFSVLALLAGGTTSGLNVRGGERNLGEPAQAGTAQGALSEVPGCHFFVDSNYGGNPLWMARGSTISNLKDRGMNDKISSVYLRGGATTRMWIHRNYEGRDWLIPSDVPTFHTSAWGNLGDNSSSIDCY